MLDVADSPGRLADEPRQSRFDELFHRLYAELYGLVYRLLGDRAEVEDTLQEGFLRLADAPQLLERPDPEVAAWMRRVCLNLGSNRLRDERRARARLEKVGRWQLAEPSADATGPAHSLLRAEQQTEVRRALARLPEQQRSCLLLRHSGYSYAEVAETLGLAIGSVGVLLTRAERAFRIAYQEEVHP